MYLHLRICVGMHVPGPQSDDQRALAWPATLWYTWRSLALQCLCRHVSCLAVDCCAHQRAGVHPPAAGILVCARQRVCGPGGAQPRCGAVGAVQRGAPHIVSCEQCARGWQPWMLQRAFDGMCRRWKPCYGAVVLLLTYWLHVSNSSHHTILMHLRGGCVAPVLGRNTGTPEPILRQWT